MATINKEKSGRWRAQIRLKGHAPVAKTFRTKAMAERWATQTEDQIRSGTYQDRTLAAAIPLAAHLDWYLNQITPRKSRSALTKEESRIHFLKGHPRFRHATLATLTPAAVMGYVDDRKAEGLAAATIARELCVLGHAIDMGMELLRIPLPHGNPVTVARKTLKHTKTLTIRDARDRGLTEAEEARLLAELGPVMREAVILLLETGMRRGELCHARRAHLRGNTLFIPEAKGKGGRTFSRTVPLSPRALAAIQALPARLDGSLIGLKPDSVTQAFARACQRAGLPDLRVHDCRHVATSRLFQRGWSVAEVAAVTGHQDWRSLKRYTQLDPEQLAAKLQAGQSPPPRRHSDTDY